LDRGNGVWPPRGTAFYRCPKNPIDESVGVGQIELRRTFISDPNIEIRYWKNRQGYEIDFVVLWRKKVKALIQVSWDISNPETRKRETRSLKGASKSLGGGKKIIVTYDQEEYDQKEGIAIVPIWKILINKIKISDLIPIHPKTEGL